MERYYGLLLEAPLFRELTIDELPHMLNCLEARKRSFATGEFIIRESEPTEELAVVLEGRVMIVTEDLFGNRSITAKLGVGELFGQVAASKTAANSPVSVISEESSIILFIQFKNLVTPCSNACSFHSRVIENMVNVLGDRNLMMNRKLSILSQRSTRDKLLAFLAWYGHDTHSSEFTIPYTREELADYLCVNRSALSREISNMVAEGILTTNRNHFVIHQSLEV